MPAIYQNESVRIEIEESEIPWLKIFTQQPFKEMSECDDKTKRQIWVLLDLIEVEMLDYFKPDKINIASFANYLPQVHWHIMARYKQDSFFPEPMWGKKQREAQLNYPPMDVFITKLTQKITESFKP
ncbi:MAG: HIT family protein [Cocleimonas sp.]